MTGVTHEPDEIDPQARRNAALRRAWGPGVALLLTGLVNAGLGVLVMVSGLSTGWFGLAAEEGVIGFIAAIGGVLSITGGRNLIGLGSRGMVITGSVTAMIPCLSVCLPLGIPIGLWAILTAERDEVRAEFRSITLGSQRKQIDR